VRSASERLKRQNNFAGARLADTGLLGASNSAPNSAAFPTCLDFRAEENDTSFDANSWAASRNTAGDNGRSDIS
jgi:hypothetical protein